MSRDFRIEVSVSELDNGEIAYYVIEETGPEESDTNYLIFGTADDYKAAYKAVTTVLSEVFDL